MYESCYQLSQVLYYHLSYHRLRHIVAQLIALNQGDSLSYTVALVNRGASSFRLKLPFKWFSHCVSYPASFYRSSTTIKSSAMTAIKFVSQEEIQYGKISSCLSFKYSTLNLERKNSKIQ